MSIATVSIRMCSLNAGAENVAVIVNTPVSILSVFSLPVYSIRVKSTSSGLVIIGKGSQAER